MLDVYYTREGAIPEADAARLIGARSKDEREALKVVLAEFFTVSEGSCSQERADREIARFKDKQAKAKKSAEARWGASQTQSEGNANASKTHDADGMRTQSEGNATRARPQSPVTSNHSVSEIPYGRRGSRLPPDWSPGESGFSFAASVGMNRSRADAEAAKFIDYWASKSGKDATKNDWEATWRNWVRKAMELAPKTANAALEDIFAGAK